MYSRMNSRSTSAPIGPNGERKSIVSRMSVPSGCSSKTCSWTHFRYGPSRCSSTKRCGGSQAVISVRQRNGSPRQWSRYFKTVPRCKCTDSGVRIWKCSQGGVIPHGVGTLAADLPGMDADDVPARKGSTWLLTFGPDAVLRTADYYEHPTG